MGYDWYTRAATGLFRLTQPKGRPIGFDALPEWVRSSPVLTGQQIAKLASVTARPDTNARAADATGDGRAAHARLQELLDRDQVLEAWTLVNSIEASVQASR
jgi:hypothetical protein